MAGRLGQQRPELGLPDEEQVQPGPTSDGAASHLSHRQARRPLLVNQHAPLKRWPLKEEIDWTLGQRGQGNEV